MEMKFGSLILLYVFTASSFIEVDLPSSIVIFSLRFFF